MKLRVAVVFGGCSTEHEISVISALQAIQSMDSERYDILPVYMSKDGDFYVGEEIGVIESYTDIPALLAKSSRVVWTKDGHAVKLIRYPLRRFGNNELGTADVVFPIVHGTNTEDGTLAGFFHTFGLPVVGPDVLSSAVGMDKYVMKTVLKDNGIPVLGCRCYSWKDQESPERMISDIEAAFPYPVIVKPLNLGSSIGISRAEDRAALQDALDLAFEFSRKLLIEPAITRLKEINCAVLGDYEEAIASECEEPVSTAQILSFEDKYIGGGKGKGGVKGATGTKDAASGTKGMASLKRKLPADISPELRERVRALSVRAFQCLGCSGVSRIDFMLDETDGSLYLNEINTIPGSLSFYLWEPLGISYTELLNRLIQLALKADRENRKTVFSFETNVLSGIHFSGAKGKA